MPIKTGRTRYMRLFPERCFFALEQLTEREFVAWIRLMVAYVVADGELACDDKRLALLTKMGSRWPELRDKLAALGLGRLEAGFWIDDDQARNLGFQQRASERGERGAAVRWGERRG